MLIKNQVLYYAHLLLNFKYTQFSFLIVFFLILFFYQSSICDCISFEPNYKNLYEENQKKLLESEEALKTLKISTKQLENVLMDWEIRGSSHQRAIVYQSDVINNLIQENTQLKKLNENQATTILGLSLIALGLFVKLLITSK